ncbi:MAG: cyclic pyranopterin monophosphate synthase MoaC [Pseudomonadota bacterium]
MSDKKLSHLDQSGKAQMVDITAKPVTARHAIASGDLSITPDIAALIKDGKTPKGDVFATARIAAIQAAKKTSELIPLCHPLPLSGISCEFTLEKQRISVSFSVKTTGQTGVEMEAMTGCSAALLTLYDMLKAVDKSMVMSNIRLEAKSGGKSGDYQRSSEA